MSRKKILQMSVVAAIASILVSPAGSFVTGQIIPATDLDVSITEPLDGVILNMADVDIDGTASGDDLDSVEVLVDSISQGNATLTDSSWTISLILAEGQRNVTAVARDNTNNTASHSIDLIIDLTNPSVEITSPEDLALFNNGIVNVNGTASDANGIQLVEVSIDDGQFENATGTNEWSFEASLSDGNHSITARATDNAGNSNSTSIDVTVETQDPQISITSPSNNAILNSSNVTINGTASDANGIQLVEVSIDDGQFENATGTNEWSFSTILQDGTYNATARAIDTFGNSVEEMISFTIDTEMPSIAITSPSDSQLINLVNVTITGTVSNNSVESVTVSIDGSEAVAAALNSTSGEWSFEAVDLEDGEHQVNATAIDSAGNEAMTSSSFTVDTIGPEILITSPANNSTLTASNVTINGTASDANGIQLVEVSIDDNTFGAATGNESWSFNAVLENGTHTITARATDNAGNSTTESISITVETPEEPAELLTIQGIVFHDANGDGIRQSNETGIQGWYVWIGGIDNQTSEPIISNTLTGADGNYSFVDLGAGSYALTPEPREGAVITFPATGKHIVTLLSNMQGLDFGIQLTVVEQPPDGGTSDGGQTNENVVPDETPVTQTPSPNQSNNGFSCNDQILTGRLEISDTTATFENCDIRGTVRITNSDATFENSTIRGNVKVSDSDLTVLSSELRGNLHDDGGAIILDHNTIRGNVKLCNAEIISMQNNTWIGSLHFCNEDPDDDSIEQGNASSHSDKGDSSNGKGKSDNSSSNSGSSSNDKGNSGNNSGSNSGNSSGNNSSNNEKDKGKNGSTNDKGNSGNSNNSSNSNSNDKGNSNSNDKGNSNSNDKGNSGSSNDKGNSNGGSSSNSDKGKGSSDSSDSSDNSDNSEENKGNSSNSSNSGSNGSQKGNSGNNNEKDKGNSSNSSGNDKGNDKGKGKDDVENAEQGKSDKGSAKDEQNDKSNAKAEESGENNGKGNSGKSEGQGQDQGQGNDKGNGNGKGKK